MTEEEILKLIKILIGNITPIGDESIDNEAANGMTKLINIMKEFHIKINHIASLEDNECDSKKHVIEIANDYLDWLDRK